MSYQRGYRMTLDDVRVKGRSLERKLWRNVYIWMALGLMTTAGVAYLSVSTEIIRSALLSNRLFASLGIMFGLFGLILFMSRRLQTMSMAAAVSCYVLYTVLEGLLLFSLFLFYDSYVLIKTFVAASSMFIGMSLWGAFSKRDLSSMGRFCVMLVWGLLFGILMNLFLKSSFFDYVISFIGVLVFAGLTAYDTQKILRMSKEMGSNIDESSFVKASIMGALILYIDFIGLFLFLLRFTSGGMGRD